MSEVLDHDLDRERPVRTPQGELLKWCSRCQEEKLAREFALDRSAKDELQRWCRECYRAYQESRVRRFSRRPTQEEVLAESAEHWKERLQQMRQKWEREQGEESHETG